MGGGTSNPCTAYVGHNFGISILSASLRPHKDREDIAMADMAVDKKREGDMELDMVADMEVDKVAYKPIKNGQLNIEKFCN